MSDAWEPTESVGMVQLDRSTRVKICGITSVHDAQLAAAAGADAIGLVFAESPRQLNLKSAAAIVQALPPFVTPVALFANATPEHIIATCEPLGIRTVQLHGNETPRILAELTSYSILKAFRIADQATISGVRLWLDKAPYWPAGLLFDSFSRRTLGGSGETFDWNLIPPRHVRGEKPALVLAGGLNPDNVEAAIQLVQPHAVDVSSGVESAPGQKDPQLIIDFIAAVRRSR